MCNDYLQIVQSQGFNVRTIQNNSNFFTKFFSTNAINSRSKIKKKHKLPLKFQL